jgi:anti-sigma regulatory factor (Ser/Thr protein kinase)
MCQFGRRSYQSTAAAPSQGRQFLRDHLAGAVPESATIEDAALVVSELVTNAVHAGSRQIVLDIALHRDHVRIAVSDDAYGQPEVGHPAVTATSGRGLMIVNALARQWGTTEQQPGKEVWAYLAIKPSAARECHLPEAT